MLVLFRSFCRVLFIIFLVYVLDVWTIIPSGFKCCAAGIISVLSSSLLDSC